MISNDKKLFDYYAFISYKRADYNFAKWLREKLSAYKLPLSTYNFYEKKIARKTSPVFLDKVNLTPGMLDNSLMEEVQASKYLIVLCSTAAHDNSKYLDEEISFFLEGGGAVSNIVAVVLEKNDDPVENCFPLKLKEVWQEYPELQIINAAVEGKKKAFLGLVAYMHGIDISTLKKGERRRKLLISGFIAAACILIFFAGFCAFKYFVPQKHYFVDYTESYGIPIGLGELSTKQIKRLNEHYTIITKRGIVTELRHENSYGNLIDHDKSAFFDRPTDSLYMYSKGKLDKVIRRDRFEQTEVIWDYKDDDLTTVDLIQYDEGEDEGISKAGFVKSGLNDNLGSAFGLLKKDYNESSYSNIARYKLTYNENGYVKYIIYYSDWRNSYLACDENGVGAKLYKRDELGRVTLINYFKPTGETTGDFFKDFTNADLDNGVAGRKLTYTDDYRVYQDILASLDNKPIESSSGYAAIQYTYDENGNMVLVRYYDADLKQVIIGDGYFQCLKDYDDAGNLIVDRYFDIEGNRVVTGRGYSAVGYEYDKKGNMVFLGYYDTEDQMINLDAGYGYICYDYDENRDVVCISYYDRDDNLVMVPDYGYSTVRYAYEDHKAIRRELYDTNDNLVIGEDGYAIRGIQYWNDYAYVFYYGTDRSHIINKKTGDAALAQRFDARGNLVEEASLDTDLKPVMNYLGYCATREFYDNRGNIIYEVHLDVNSEPCDPVKGLYCQNFYEYDSEGNEINRESYNKSLEIEYQITSEYGKHRALQQTYESYYSWGVDYLCSYYESGMIKEAYIVDSDTDAYVLTEYDEDGNEISCDYNGSEEDYAKLLEKMDNMMKEFEG